MSGEYFIGLISGTSRDGVDAALVLFEDDTPRLLHALCLPYQEPLKSDLEKQMAAGREPTEAVGGTLDEFLGRHFARAARTLIEQAGVEWRDISAIGSHGQTVWHGPDDDPPRSIQLGSPQVLSRTTGRIIVSHFRQGDMAAGGQGAPLAPLLHRQLFADDRENRVVVNLGGISNLTFLYSDGGMSGYDAGPANCLLDLWIGLHRGLPFDRDGEWAASGRVLPDLLRELLAEPYFSRPPPKSTGLERFNLRWLKSHAAAGRAAPADVQSTLSELTARTVADGILAAGEPISRVLVCGGGVHNTDLLGRLAARLPGIPVESTRAHGMHPDWVEAVLFAWLARERIRGRTQDTRAVTGASEPVLLGAVHDPDSRLN